MAGAIADLKAPLREGARRGEGDRLLRPDARRGAARPRRTGRFARRSCTTTDARIEEAAGLARDLSGSGARRRGEADAGLYRAEAPVARPPRAGASRHHRLRAAPKDYLRLALSGERAPDMSDAAGSWMLDEAARAWSPRRSRACDADPAWAPPLLEGSARGGPNPSRGRRRLRPAARARSSPPAAATRPSARSASARSRRAKPSSRSAPRPSSSSRPTAT